MAEPLQIKGFQKETAHPLDTVLYQNGCAVMVRVVGLKPTSLAVPNRAFYQLNYTRKYTIIIVEITGKRNSIVVKIVANVVKIVAKPDCFCTFKHLKKPKNLALQGISLFCQNHKNFLQQRPKAGALSTGLHPEM